MNAKLDGTDDIFDSRDVIERISEMELEYGPEDGDSIDTLHLERITDEEREEYDALVTLREQADDNGDWPYGMTFISEDYFDEYARELVEDLGYVSKDMPSWIAIDWDRTADRVKEDYTSYEFRGTTYWAR